MSAAGGRLSSRIGTVITGAEHPTLRESGERTVRLLRRITARPSLTLVVVALVFLAVVPFFIQERVAVSLDEITRVVEPANTAVSDMQVALALEAAGTRGFLLTGDEQYARSHLQARSARRRAYMQLAGLAGQLDPRLRDNVLDIGDSMGPADELLDALFSRRITRQEYLTYLPLQQGRFQSTTAATARLHDAITAQSGARRAHVRAIQRVGSILALAGVFLALGASISVARLSAARLSLAERERAARAASEQARAEAELGRQQLEQISASRERLIRGFSHDLRNPLGAADGYLIMLQSGVMGPLAPAQRRCVDTAHRSVTASIRLIEDVLELARAEKGTLEVRAVPTDLRDVVARTIDEYRAQADNKALTISTQFPAALPVLQSDPARVGQILGNLISNAIKYTESGGLTVRLGVRRDDGGCERAAVDVCDTGPGIPKEELESIFDEFYRLQNDAGIRGTGIGLAISQRVATLLGGHISVESEPGHGSTFTLWLPMEAAEPVSNGLYSFT